MIQCRAQEEASMAKTCEQAVAGNPSLSVLHLSSWRCKAWDKTQDVLLVMCSLHLFLNLSCKGNNIFKHSFCLLYPQGLGLHLALVQLCRAEKSCLYLTGILEYSFREKKMSKTDSQLCIFCFSLFFCKFSSTGETLKSMWRWCAFRSINVQELCVCISSDWNIDTEKVIHDITQQCKFFSRRI